MAMNKSLPRTQDFFLMQSLQRKVQTPIERKDAYIKQVSKDRNTISTFKNYVAELSSSKIDQDDSSRVLRIYILCWRLRIGRQNWRTYGTNTDLCNN